MAGRFGGASLGVPWLVRDGCGWVGLLNYRSVISQLAAWPGWNALEAGGFGVFRVSYQGEWVSVRNGLCSASCPCQVVSFAPPSPLIKSRESRVHQMTKEHRDPK